MTVLFMLSVEDIVHCINKSLDMGTVEETHTLIQKREGLFPKVLTRSAFLYHDGLYKAKQQVLQVRVTLFTWYCHLCTFSFITGRKLVGSWIFIFCFTGTWRMSTFPSSHIWPVVRYCFQMCTAFINLLHLPPPCGIHIRAQSLFLALGALVQPSVNF